MQTQEFDKFQGEEQLAEFNGSVTAEVVDNITVKTG